MRSTSCCWCSTVMLIAPRSVATVCAAAEGLFANFTGLGHAVVSPICYPRPVVRHWITTVCEAF